MPLDTIPRYRTGRILPRTAESCSAGFSVISETRLLITPAERNWTRDIRIPSHFGEKRSIVRICTGKITAQPSTSRSEGRIEKSDFMQSR